MQQRQSNYPPPSARSNFNNPELIGCTALDLLTGLFTKSILILLSRFPSAQAIVRADPAEITQLLIDRSKGRNTAKTTEAIIQAARSSV